MKNQRIEARPIDEYVRGLNRRQVGELLFQRLVESNPKRAARIVRAVQKEHIMEVCARINHFYSIFQDLHGAEQASRGALRGSAARPGTN